MLLVRGVKGVLTKTVEKVNMWNDVPLDPSAQVLATRELKRGAPGLLYFSTWDSREKIILASI